MKNGVTVALLASLSLLGCSPQSNNKTDDSTTSKISTTVETCLKFQKYRSEDYVFMNDAPYPSALVPDKTIEVYVSDFAFRRYNRIHPEIQGSNVEVPEETIIVRKVWDEDHYLDKYTIMVKAEEGYYPEGGDFYYAVLDGTGEYMKDDNGKELKGKIDECADCHRQTRSDDGFLFGVPATTKRSISYFNHEEEARASAASAALLSGTTPSADPDFVDAHEQRVKNTLTTRDLAILEAESASGAQFAFTFKEAIGTDKETGSTLDYFGVFNADGSIAFNASGLELSGQLSPCQSCHNDITDLMDHDNFDHTGLLEQ